jgi:sorting nexin-8
MILFHNFSSGTIDRDVDRIVRSKIGPLIEQWQRICILAERVIRRREAAAVWFPPAYRPFYFPTHFTFTHPSSPSSTTSSPAQSILSDPRTPHSDAEQGDLTRLTNTLRVVVEASEHPWRGDDCELSNGVRQGMSSVAQHVQNFADLSEQRVRASLAN